jgi:hypothetical protein
MILPPFLVPDFQMPKTIPNSMIQSLKPRLHLLDTMSNFLKNPLLFQSALRKVPPCVVGCCFFVVLYGCGVVQSTHVT